MCWGVFVTHEISTADYWPTNYFTIGQVVFPLMESLLKRAKSAAAVRINLHAISQGASVRGGYWHVASAENALCNCENLCTDYRSSPERGASVRSYRRCFEPSASRDSSRNSPLFARISGVFLAHHCCSIVRLSLM